MILKKAILSFLFGIISFVVLAQSTSRQVVYLKNGSVIHGIILEMVPNESIKIQTADKNIFVFRMEEVDKVVDEAKDRQATSPQTATTPSTEPDVTTIKSAPEFKQKGFTNITKFGPLGLSAINVSMINGYTLNPHFFIGLGVSLDYYKTRDLQFFGNAIFQDNSTSSSSDPVNFFLPIFVDARYYVSDSRVSFMTFVDIGFSPFLGANKDPDYLNYSPDYKVTGGGLYMCPGIGMKVMATKNIGFIFDFGMKFQNYQTRNYNPDYTSNSTVYILGAPNQNIGITPTLNLGITF